MSKARTRLVNFRVTDEEFEQLKSDSGLQGARCLSDFARSLMLGQTSVRPISGSYEERLLSLDRRMAALERSMIRVVETLSAVQL